MRTKLGSIREVCETWAEGRKEYAICGNVYHKDGVIYSYGSHFPIARIITRDEGASPDVVLFTTRTYSTTTSSHCRMAQSLLLYERRFKVLIEFMVPNVMAEVEYQHLLNFMDYEDRMSKLVEKSKKGYKRKHSEYIYEAINLSFEANKYARTFGLAEKGEDLLDFSSEITYLKITGYYSGH